METRYQKVGVTVKPSERDSLRRWNLRKDLQEGGKLETCRGAPQKDGTESRKALN